jgi:outer membrane biosynthesis protein TonB
MTVMLRENTARFIPSFGFMLLALAGLAMAAVAAGCRTGQSPDLDPKEHPEADPAHAERVEPSRPRGDAGPPSREPPVTTPPDEPTPDPRPAPRPEPLPDPNPIPDPSPEPAPDPAQPPRDT